jgi:Fic family protein
VADHTGASSPAGLEVAISRGVNAFVPDDLPPSVSWTPELLLTLSDADRALGELAGLGRNLPNPRLLIRPFMNREAVLSSRIEGTQANVTDLYAFEAGHQITTHTYADVQEVSNYVRALEYGLERIKELPISLRLIREIHAILMRGVRGGHAAPGEFRKTQNWIGTKGCAIDAARFVPPPVPQMNVALAKLEGYIHAESDLPPLVRVGLTHYQIETIHPFADGNGRIGRLLTVLQLINLNLLPLPLLYLSAYFERHREAYYDHLLSVSRHSTWERWLVFFLTGVAEQSRDAIRRAAALQDLQATWRNAVTQARSSSLLLRLVDSLFERPVLTIRQATELLGITYRSAQKNIEKLVELGILKQLPDAYPRIYTAPGVLAAVD